MAQIGVEGCLLVWASQCLAFIRYRMWFASTRTTIIGSMSLLIADRTYIHEGNLTGDHAKYNPYRRMKDGNQFSSFLTHFQPVVAWIGLLGCLSIVLLFSSAIMWNGKVTVEKAAAAYIGVNEAFEGFSAPLADCYQPATLLLIWLALKVYSRRSWVRLDDDWSNFSKAVGDLEYLIEERESSNSGNTAMLRQETENLFQNRNGFRRWSIFRRS